MTAPSPGTSCVFCGSLHLDFIKGVQGKYLCQDCNNLYIPAKTNLCPRCNSPTKVDYIYRMCTSQECTWSTIIPKVERESVATPPKHNPPPNPVSNPSHYTQGGIECIDALQAALTPEEFRGFLKGNTIKYLWRMNHKNSPSEDARKAQWYLTKLIKELTDETV